MNSTDLRSYVFNKLPSASPNEIQQALLQAADALEQHEMQQLLTPVAPIETRKSGWFDWFVVHPRIKYRPQDREAWEGLHRLCVKDMELAYADGCYTLDEIQKWRASTPDEREKAKRIKFFTDSLRRWNFAHGYEQAKDWWTTLRNRGSVPSDVDLMVKAVEWLGRTCKHRGVSLSFANQAIALIDEYRSIAYSK